MSLALGTAGFLACHAANGFATALYRSVQLFYWNYFPWNAALEAEIPWTLELARWLAPLTTLGALSRVAVALFHRRWDAFRARHTRGHFVISGAGNKGATLARELRKSGSHAVVLIEQDEKRAEEIAAEGFLVIHGDATKAESLRQAGAPNADKVVVVTGNDHDNLAIAMTAAHLGNGPISVHAHSSCASICDLYHRNHAMAAPLAGNPAIRFFNHFRNVARLTILNFPPESAGAEAHIVLPGLSHQAIAFAVEYALIGHFTGGRRIHLHIVGPMAGQALAALRSNYPSIDRCAEIVAIDVQPTERFASFVASLANQLPTKSRFTVFPGFAENHEAFTCALDLVEKTHAHPDLRVLIPDSTGPSIRGMIEANPVLKGRIGFLPPMQATCGYEAIIGESLDRAARKIHENWLAETRLQIDNARASGNEALARRHEAKATFIPWDDLNEEQKCANRSQADHIPFKIRAAGLDPKTVTPREWRLLSPSQIEPLARMEHARWAAYYWMTGWTFDPMRDDERKQHPNLVAYDELDEPTKDYDRIAVRNLGQYLST